MIETIWKENNSRFHAEIVLIPPGIRTLKFVTWDELHSIRQLALPYCVFAYALSSKTILRNRPFLGWVNDPNSEQIYFPLMSNVAYMYDHGRHLSPSLPSIYIPRICFSSCKTLSFVDLQDIKFEMTRLLFQSEFEDDNWWPCRTLLRDTFLKSWNNWARLTRKHNSPDFMLDFDKLYRNIDRTIYVSTLSQWKEALT
jgi:hypothetical protein